LHYIYLVASRLPLYLLWKARFLPLLFRTKEAHQEEKREVALAARLLLLRSVRLTLRKLAQLQRRLGSDCEAAAAPEEGVHAAARHSRRSGTAGRQLDDAQGERARHGT
ncbi:hypothetical protein Agub_g3208, partial [Astrephomene gubernaculifera]